MTEPRMTPKRRRLLAIEEALHARLAGAIEDVGDLQNEDYEAAVAWVEEQLAKGLKR